MPQTQYFGVSQIGEPLSVSIPNLSQFTYVSFHLYNLHTFCGSLPSEGLTKHGLQYCLAPRTPAPLGL